MRADGSLVLLDWEEAVVGCPLLSLERLQAEAEELGNVSEVRAAYLDALPWGTERLADLALLLAPLKLASEAREYARVLGLPTPHTKLTATLIGRTLARR